MHPTALSTGQEFFSTYLENFDAPTVVEIGSQDVNGSLRDVCPIKANYIGLDFVEGRGVDIVLTDPYRLPLEDNSADVVVSSSCFEHSEMFWLVFLEVMRVLKPSGLLYLNVPSNGAFHRYPVDCWRFYPDSGHALVAWSQRNGLKPVLLESFISGQRDDIWNDCVAVFLKDEVHVDQYPMRMLHKHKNFENGLLYGSDELLNYSHVPEDMRRVNDLVVKLDWQSKQNAELEIRKNELEAELHARSEALTSTSAALEMATHERDTTRYELAVASDQLALAILRARQLELSTWWKIGKPFRAVIDLLKNRGNGVVHK